ncbi:hypothetical protein GCM10022197_07530 [Microlunatus spumicola]|uniref:Asp23/Gls24 family envelope stress response protein n=1 Tax=Microlunatus spumicola TaxID=81499 RepID=A0ABP6WQE8_9ACTN
MADDTRLSCGRSIDDVWSHLDGPPDEHERGCPYCLEARARLLRLSDAAAELRAVEAADPELQPDPGFTSSVMSLVRAEVRRGQSLPLDADEDPGLTISEQAVVGLVWAAADTVPGVRARRCRVRLVDRDEQPAGPTLVDVDLAVALHPGTSLRTATERLRERVRSLVAAEAGVEVRRVELVVEDVL